MNDPNKRIDYQNKYKNSDNHQTFIQPQTSEKITSVSHTSAVKKKSPLSFFKWIVITGSGSITLIIILILLGVWNLGGRLIAAFDGFLNAAPSTPEVDIPTLVISQVKGVSELTTSVFVMQTVVPTSQDQKIGNIVIAETKLLYIAHGEVRAGINLDSLTTNNIKVDNNNLEIQLPPPIILDSKIDVNRSYVYDYNRGFLGLGPDVGTDLQTLAQRETLTKITSSACEQGILKDANKKAEIAISQLLMTAGYETVEIKTTIPAENSCIVPEVE